ncbi:MAG: hypothetical protein LBS59_09015 [Puniceicoccales bacterium]|jgi:hypothetical protein|nr:hypothetical protein [Puniceicoccales bacterium]
MSTSVKIASYASPALADLAHRLKDTRPLMERLGAVAEAELRRHFLDRNSEPNKRGWAKQNFWNRIRRATALTAVTDTTATVTISDPAFVHKVTGGEVRPRGGRKFLALPMRPEAAGVLPRPGLIPELFPIRGKSGKLFLAKRDDAGGGKVGRSKARQASTTRQKRLTIYYLLVRSVTHRPDARALPQREELQGVIIAAASRYLRDALA